MSKKKLFFQIFPFFLTLIFLSLLFLSTFQINVLKNYSREIKAEDLLNRAHILEHYFNNSSLYYSDELPEICSHLGKISHMRITVIDSSGKVKADSHENYLIMDNHKDRPEIKAALTGKKENSIRYSFTLKKEMLYTAIPVFKNREITHTIRVAVPISILEKTIQNIYKKIISGAFLIILIAALISFYVAKKISSPLEKIKNGANKFAEGKLDFQLKIEGSEEIASVANNLNLMAQKVDKQLKEITNKNNEQEAILTSMVEGVIALDLDKKILFINRAATGFFKLKNIKYINKSISEVIRNSALSIFVESAIANSSANKMEINIEGELETQIFRVTGIDLKNANKNKIGILIVLNDITQMRKMEKIRSDFVANASHELKTPLTSIKGFIETIRETLNTNPKKTIHFLDIVEKQTERLNNLINDLLELSKIEQSKNSRIMPLKKQELSPIIQEAIWDCNQWAKKKNIEILIKSKINFYAKINPPLLKQALINLLNNAINYSPDSSKVELSVISNKKNINIFIRDNGCGIAQKHQKRLFERFYRVDKGRSKELGGTGLGLAIVKHIALVHNGFVSVESTPNRGSTFGIHLPECKG